MNVGLAVRGLTLEFLEPECPGGLPGLTVCVGAFIHAESLPLPLCAALWSIAGGASYHDNPRCPSHSELPLTSTAGWHIADMAAHLCDT